ncbi:MAG: class I SAM-dependent methyltransferase [Actinobacteria bacterium]|nr:class I SAM-dependent methyltransferase [Actinomycetota bacterium]
MNRYHQRVCSSRRWAAQLADSVLPAALDGVDLGGQVLELGPGYGAGTRPLASRTVTLTAVEPDPALARRLHRDLGDRVTVLTADARDLPFPDDTFSAVVCFTMLHHLPDAAAQDQAFAEAARVLRPGGTLAGSDSLPSLRWRLVHLGDVCTPVDPATLAGRLARAGFPRARVRTSPRRFFFAASVPTE